MLKPVNPRDLLRTVIMRDMPIIIYGTAWKKARTYDLVQQAYAAGFRGFDTACQPRHYDEALVGKALADLSVEGAQRSSYYLQTKYTLTPNPF